METWKSVPGWGLLYEASDTGRVRSMDKFVPAKGGAVALRRGRILTPVRKDKRYLAVTLADGDRREQHFIHSLVLLTFVGPRPADCLGRHLDDDKNNNTLANLAYGTHIENNADALRNKVKPIGARHGCAKLTDEDIKFTRESDASGAGLAVVYGVSVAQISRIRLRQAWRHL
jgi:hypothetical protein